jgi:hypothetical protein
MRSFPRWPRCHRHRQRSSGRLFRSQTERITPLGLAGETGPLVRQVLPQENIDDLRHDVTGTLVELFLGEVGDGVGHR